MSRTRFPHPAWSVCTGLTEDGRIGYAGRYGAAYEDPSGAGWRLPVFGWPLAYVVIHAHDADDADAALAAEKGRP